MPTKEQLESALINAHKAGDTSAAKRLANAIKGGEFDQPKPTRLPLYAGDHSGLDEIGASDELNQFAFDSLKGSAAANLIHDDFELAGALGEIFPEATFEQTADNDVIARLPSGDFFLNKPGLSGQDVSKFLTRAGLFALTMGKGRGIDPKTLLGLAGRSSATEAGLQGVEAGLGGEANPVDVAVAGVAAPVGQVVGEKVITPALKAGPDIAKRAFTGIGNKRKEFVQAVSDFAEISQTPSIGQASGDGLRQGLETISSKMLGGGPIRNALTKTTTKMQNRLAAIADDISPVKGDVETGRVIQKGIIGEDGFVARMAEKGGKLWGALDDKITPNAQSDVEHTKDVLQNLVRNDEFGRILNNPKLTQLKTVFDSTLGKSRINQVTQTRETVTTIPYSTIKSLRTQVGEMLGGKDLMSDVPRQQLKSLYAALSKDIKVVANDNNALREFNRANAFTKSVHGRIDDFVERVAKKVDLDKVFNAVARGGEGVQSLNAFKRSLKPDEWEAVSANVIRRLGRATSGNQDELGEAFSVPKMLTDWDKLGPAKKVLFSGSSKLNEYSKNMDRIARVARRFKDDIRAMDNPSGTGQFLANVGLVSGGAGAAVTGNVQALGLILAGVTMNNGAARLMTNPRFVNWLAQSSKVSNLPAHITKLAVVAESSGHSEEILELMDTLTQAGTKQDSSEQ